jgi:putative redox protein
MINVLTKQKEQLDDVKIKITATRKDQEVPAIFDVITIHFDLFGQLSVQKVERALDLTFEKYCSVSNILGRSSTINFSYTIHN